MSENRPPKYAHSDSKKLSEFSKLKNQTKKLPLKIQKLKKKLKIIKCQKTDPPKFAHSEYKKSLGGPREELEGGPRSGPNF